MWLHYDPELRDTDEERHSWWFLHDVGFPGEPFLNAFLNLLMTTAQQSPSQQSTCVLSLTKLNQPSNMDIPPNNDCETFVSRSTVKVSISRTS